MNTLASKPLVCQIREFLYTPSYIFLICFLTAISNIFSAELIVYTCFVLIGLFICICGRDLLPIVPIVICCYIAPSSANNPGRNETSIFAPGHGGIYLMSIAAILIICLIWRLFRDPQWGGRAFLKARRYLMPGMLFLGATYLLAGLGSPYFLSYGIRNALFGAMQFVAIFGMYFLLTGGVEWEKVPENYLSWVGIGVGYVLIAELANLYLTKDIIIDGEIYRKAIITGWGHYNNLAALLLMMLPFPFAMACKYRRNEQFYLTALIFMVGILFTCSRGSILFGVPVYLICYIISLTRIRKLHSSPVIHIAMALLAVSALILFRDKLVNLFQILIEKGFNPSDRDTIYKAGLEQFRHDPFFGGTFFPVAFPDIIWSTSEAFVAIFPVRWHNTIVQILASCGLFGMAAYGFHRYQTVRLFLKKMTCDNVFIAVSLLGLLATSLLDCHLFNIGPTLFYSMALAFAEKRESSGN